MGTAASNLNNALQLAGSKLGITLFKNPRGMVTLKDGRKFKYGVGPNGASDLLGYIKITITPDMVGKQIAQFTVVEGKAGDDTVKEKQSGFIEQVIRDGGRGCVARCPEDLCKL